ncbi:serine carboxypeptidase [Peniophora sp. CONT]|nr:serine carboxypeptidase [Peniophora sp. CONT]
MVKLVFALLGAAGVALGSSSQWTTGDAWSAYDAPADGFSAVGALSSVQTESFTSFSHPLFPKYSARIKQTEWCDSTVKAYTGYIDIEARHLFFYFFESRNSPAEDPVVLWTNGGPGCSSSLGLLMELGPCRVTNATGKAEFFAESWNNNANVFFIDQPINVGYSYSEFGETVYTTEEAAVDVAKFVFLFFENFPQFKGRAFHMAGESYGGRYIPLFAAAVYDQNALLEANGYDPVNLSSAIIGNGMTDPAGMVESYYDMTCTGASVFPVLPISTCVRMKKALPRCHKWTKESCIDQFDAMNCEAASSFCSSEIMSPFFTTGLNVYDISRPCEDPEHLCYSVTGEISGYLSRPDVRELLGVDSHVPPVFSSCNNDINSGFHAADDSLRASTAQVGALLERGVRVLIYVGTYDFICNHVGNSLWSLALEWSGKEAFNAAPLRNWTVGGEKAGDTRSAKGFTFATVDAAGHMVPYDKPKQALALINRWLNATSL